MHSQDGSFPKTHSEAVTVELPHAFCGLGWWLQVSEVLWEVGDEDGGLVDGFRVIFSPFISQLIVARYVLGCEVTPEEVGRVGICG